MSWDLSVATRAKPDRELLQAWAAAEGVVIEANAVQRPSGETLFMADGPSAVEADDLDEALADAVDGAAWMLEIIVPLGTERRATKALAMSLGRFVAERCGGAVYDKQRDELVWPERHAAAPRARVEIETIELVWYARPGRVREGAAALVSAAQRLFPPALPRRYGTSQPYRSRMDPASASPFVDAWRDCQHGMFMWSAAPPCFGGSVSFPRDPDDAASRPIGRIHVTLDRRALADRSVREGIVAFFVDVAASLRAFYAAGAVRRGLSVSRGRVWVNGDSERLDLPYSEWVGLPQVATWLAWYAAPYAALVEPILAGHAQPRDGGLLVRASDQPLDADALASRIPALPPSLIGSHADQRDADVLPAL